MSQISNVYPIKNHSRRAGFCCVPKRWTMRAALALFIFLVLPGSARPDDLLVRNAPLPQGAKTILDLQPHRKIDSIRIKSAAGQDGVATLIQLNPSINDWYVLKLSWQGRAGEEAFHLENARPVSQRLILEDGNGSGLTIADGDHRVRCDLWGVNSKDVLKAAKASGLPYVPLCGGTIYLRNAVSGHRTRIESVTEFLRDEVPAGEKIVTFVRDKFFVDRYREISATAKETKPAGAGPAQRASAVTPHPAWIDPARSDSVIVSSHLGIELQDSSSPGIVPGSWYPVKDSPGVYISLIAPNLIRQDIMQSSRNVVSALDKAESEALVYLIAFDLDDFELEFSLGTAHPGVGWSERIPDRMRDASMPGPDGIGTIAPLVSTGMVGPADSGKAIATFAGGFKRLHGAFKWGELANRNHGSHYGFIESGVVFSRLQPGLATVYVVRDGRLNMKTWSEEDNALLPGIRSARQNGVPIIADYDSTTRMSVPGPLVTRWGEGNWSGSEDQKLRTMRAGAALMDAGAKRFLLYAVFTSATPSAMARVFQAYDCRYAMLLDMNALEHTYLALYTRKGSNLSVQYLVRGMGEVDKPQKGPFRPRFLGYADNRDFFTVLRKETK